MTKITSLDAVNILYLYIKNSILMTGDDKPNGGLYKDQRPINSDKEDVVINSLPMNREDLQNGILNVNLFVPNLSVKLNNVIDNSQPDIKRLTTLAGIASGVFNEFWSNSDYHFCVQQDNLFADENNQHYINFRIEFYNINL